MKPRTPKLTAKEVRRFEELAAIKWDEKQPLEVRSKAATELARWTDGKSAEFICDALISVAEDATKSGEVRVEANFALLRLTSAKSPELVCTVFRGLYRKSGNDVATCAKCSKQVDDEAHCAGYYPGMYCGTCCPACSLIPREHLKEIPMVDELEDEIAAHGFVHAEPIAREIVWIVRRDQWNISPGVN